MHENRIDEAGYGATRDWLLAPLLLMVSCVSSPTPPPQFASSTENLEGLEPRQCVNENSEPVQCYADSDCCAGFICGKDPQLSRRQTYCLFGG